ncbi:branched-chain amino acid ABC transporter permease [Cryobacterium sp. M15]|uniref:branched-chain amino acid ABC transporter permease n=1 Tax=Cryobacterium sp. M15 TaxID=2048291 RepID=UPI001304AE31|nr:branched-chain amino acid ABC transporter permease [Cryobacterium sp. M15]
MNLLLQGVVSGILVGGLFSIVAMGLAVQFSVMRVINFAQGVFLMLGAYLALFLKANLGIDPYLGSVAAFAALFLVGYIIMGTVLQRLLNSDPVLPLIATFGIAMAVQNLVVATVGATPRQADALWSDEIWHIGDVTVPVSRVIAFGLAAVSVVVLVVIVKHTRLGRFMRATSSEPVAAALSGINVKRVDRLAFGLGCGLAGFAGAIILPVLQASPFVGDQFMVNAFVIVLIGGLGSIVGSGIAGLLVGVLTGVGSLILPGSLVAALLFVLLIAVMMFRPYGLFGGKREALIYRSAGH